MSSPLTRSCMKRTNKILQLLVIALNGSFIGAMILIAIVLVPFWQLSEPQLFLDWFSTYGHLIGSVMVPFGPSVLILAILTCCLSTENRKLWLLTIIFILANMLYYPIYYVPTNTSFAEQTIDVARVSNEISTWLTLHWQRIFFAIAALVTSILAVTKKPIK